jgi:hypothetical protein
MVAMNFALSSFRQLERLVRPQQGYYTFRAKPDLEETDFANCIAVLIASSFDDAN